MMPRLNDEDDPLDIDFDEFLKCPTSPPGPGSSPPATGQDFRDASPSLTVSIPESHDGENYNIVNLVAEALEYYGTQKPIFCCCDKGEKSRDIRLTGKDQEEKLAFCTWPGGPWGYWMFTDPIGDQYICKYHKGFYYVWEGVREGLSKQAMARPKVHQKISNENGLIALNRKEDDEQHVSSKVEDGDWSGRRPLRKRTPRQQKPYAMYRLEIQNEKKGIVATESQLADSLPPLTPRGETATQVISSDQDSANKVVDEMDFSPSGFLQRSMTPSTVHPDTPSFNTAGNGTRTPSLVAYSRLDSSTGPSIALGLARMDSSVQLFEALRERWKFKLGTQMIHYVIARFSWLDDDHSLLMQSGDEDTYRAMCDLVRAAPDSTTGGQVVVNLEVCTKTQP